MRVPISIAVVACILTTVVVWIIGTRDKDFTTPPTPERLVEVANEWTESRPNIPPPKGLDQRVSEKDRKENPTPSAIRKEPEPEPLPMGELSHAPSLSHYGVYGDKGADAMIRLATQLETKGSLQHALLAWERVIDTSSPTTEQRNKAITAIKRLKPSLPPWNPDPSGDIRLTLHAGASLTDKAPLEEALAKVAGLLSETSGHVIQVNTKASIGKVNGQRTPRIPIAIWFSRAGQSPASPPAETPPISFMTEPGQTAMLASQIEAGVYALLRAHLASETNFTPLPEYPAGVTPEDLLRYHVTRLMWREFVNSIKE